MIDTQTLVEKRDRLQAMLEAIPPTDPNTAEWHARHEHAVKLQGGIEVLDQLIARSNDVP